MATEKASVGPKASAVRAVEAIADRTAGPARVFGKSFSRDIVATISARNRQGQLSSVLAALGDLFADRFAAMSRTLYDSTIAAFLGGGVESVSAVLAPNVSAPLDSAAAGLITRDTPEPQLIGIGGGDSGPPVVDIFYPDEGPSIDFPVLEAAGEQLRDAGVMSSEDYYALASDARRDAFTITADVEQRTLDHIHEILGDTFDTSGNREAFIDRVKRDVDDLPISEGHIEQVFRNNVNGAYSDGAEKILSQPAVGDSFPYRAYEAIGDDRVRADHIALMTAGLDGTNVYHVDDPVWQLFRPPWSWNCRCGFVALTVRQAADRGVREAQTWLRTGREPAHRPVALPPFKPHPKWERV